MALYILLAAIIAVTDIFIAALALQRNTPEGKYLGYTCFFAAMVDVSYTISVFLTEDAFAYSVFSSIYFFTIDLMLLSVLSSVAAFIRLKETKGRKIFRTVTSVWAGVEMIFFAVNPFTEIAISYVPRGGTYSVFEYSMKPLYYCHLAFTYMLVVMVLFLLFYKHFCVPAEYRQQYIFIIEGIAFLVVLNAIYLFAPSESFLGRVDISVLGYSVVLLLIYWACFRYSETSMRRRFESYVFKSISQGIVMFDIDETMILKNSRAASMLPDVSFEERMTLGKFISQSCLPLSEKDLKVKGSVQCYVRDERSVLPVRPLRCDYHPILGKKDRFLGELFVFTDATLDTDILTGFQSWESFKRLILAGNFEGRKKAIAAGFDITGLTSVNEQRGHEIGDQQIKDLSEKMKAIFPNDTYFVRGNDAALIALCFGKRYSDVMEAAYAIVRSNQSVAFGVGMEGEEQTGLKGVVNSAFEAINNKKMLDPNSRKSDALSSIITALEECDSETEEHVERTKVLGYELGRRLNLTDLQQSRLALLCLLHDIGKIGVPLEVLNKPGKLTEAEFHIVKAHVDKGYQIAMSNADTEHLADLILHHHERWDGDGYPSGLKGEDIPLLSRFIAVVDSYDAMTSDRPYSSAMTPADAINELKRCSGTQFDPKIVSRFVAMLADKPGLVRESDLSDAVLEKAAKQDKVEKKKISDTVYLRKINHSVYVLDDKMNIISVDDYFENITFYTKDDVKAGLTQLDLLPEEDRAQYVAMVSEQIAQNSRAYIQHRIRRKDGVDVTVMCYGTDYYDSVDREYRTRVTVFVKNAYKD